MLEDFGDGEEAMMIPLPNVSSRELTKVTRLALTLFVKVYAVCRVPDIFFKTQTQRLGCSIYE
jgi:hypothetical protein